MRLRQRLLLSSSVMMTAFAGYGGRAYAACVNTGGTTYQCSGTETTTQTINANDATVSTAAGFSVDTSAGSGNAITITGDGALSYTDINASSLTAAGTALYLNSTGDIVSGNVGSVTVNTDGALSGANNGINARNSGSGALSVTANGDVNGTNADGIFTFNYPNGTDLTVTTGGAVTGGNYGIDARNFGTGALTVTANGDVTGTNAGGIFARNSNGTDLFVTTGGAVIGDDTGINTQNYGTGALSVTANGDVTSTNGNGIFARNGSFSLPAGTDLTVTTGGGTTVFGGLVGIEARNFGTGALSITANGTVTGINGHGIYAYNYAYGTDITVTTGASSTVSGNSDGIDALNLGGGALTIAASGTVYGGAYSNGIFARNEGTNITVTTGAGRVAGGYRGIYAFNAGSGALTITTNGDVAGTNAEGIYARNDASGTDLSVTTGPSTYGVTGNEDGIYARNFGTRALSITANGDVSGTGTNADGITAYNASTGTNLAVTIGAGSTVTGGEEGIEARNYGTGALSITANGNVTGINFYGIYAYNASGTDLSVTTGAGGTITGGTRGIFARNFGTGALSITANGDVSGTTDNGIFALNSASGTDLTVTTGATVGGGIFGIDALNRGSGALAIAANGDVTGTNADGIFAYNASAGTDLSVTTGAGTAVSGGRHGIDARNYGTGALSVTANGDVTGTNDGIYAKNYGTDLSVTTGPSTYGVTGNEDGIYARNFGTGALTVTANGDVSGTTDNGIFALNSASGTDLSVTTGAGAIVIGGSFGITARNYGTNLSITTGAGGAITGGTRGIFARNYGSGALTIAANGDVTGTNSDGVYAKNNAGGTDLTVTTGAGAAVIGGDNGIFARNDGTGALTVTANGDVTGADIYGIYARNSVSGTDLSVTTGPSTYGVTGDTGGIEARNFGGGVLSITANGNVTGTGGTSDGISAQNGAFFAPSGTELSVTTGVGTTVSGDEDGIDARNYGSGALSVTANGDVIGTNGDGIYARHGTGGPIAVTVGALGAVTSSGAGADDFAIDIVGGLATVMLAGTLNGGAGGALQFDNFTNELALETGAVVNGNVLGGTATDTLALQGTGIGTLDIGRIQNFEIGSKDGSGQWTLTGTNNAAMAFTVDAGLLSVNGSMTGTSFTVNGGTLGGSGTLGALTVGAGGTLAPGNSPGILSVDSLTLAAGSTTQMEINGPTPGSEHDQINVTNVATLDGTLDLVFGFVPGDGDQFNLINAGSLVLAGDPTTGFATITDNLGAALLATAVIDPTSFDILIELTQQSFVAVGGPDLTMNQHNVASALDVVVAAGDLPADLLDELNLLSAGALPGAFDSLSGVQYTHAQTLALAAAQQFGGVLFDRLGGGAAMAGDAGKTRLAYNGNNRLPQLADAGSEASPLGSVAQSGTGLWLRGFGGFGSIDDTANASGADHSSGGVALGADTELGHGLVAGAAFGYLHTDIDTAEGDLDVDNFQGAVYGGWTQAATYLNGSATFGYHDSDGKRRVVVGGFNETARADFDGWTAGFSGEGGRSFALSGEATLTPFLGLDYNHLRRNDFTETGAGSANLTVDDEDQDSLRSSLGLRLGGVFTTESGLAIRPTLEAAWVHEYIDDEARLTAGFAAAPTTTFRIAGPDLDRDHARLGAGVSAALGDTLSLDAGYRTELAASDRTHNFAATLRWRF